MLTKVFKSGNSLAVRIPKELGFVDAAQDIEVERVGNTLVLRLVEQETLADIGKIFSMFSPAFMSEGREFHPEHDRNGESTSGVQPKAQG
jgi:antitoxin VapB